MLISIKKNLCDILWDLLHLFGKSNNGRTSHLIFPQSHWINFVISEHPCKVIDLHVISNCFVNYCI